jgi:ADP-ribosylglycohydrolase/protein-tyrosine phosphatase
MVKTSETNPLIINGVAIPGGGGTIGLTFCPGKKGEGVYSGTWDRDLECDLKSIQAFGAKALVTLMESHELSDFQVSPVRLAERVRACGMEWHHLPIRDVNPPDSRFEDRWTYSGPRLRTMLARGENIVIHCLGGLGRTGTVAGRLLVEFGEHPENAIRRIREARRGSIETFAQENYVKGCRAVTRSNSVREEKLLASLLGGAVGDALGYVVEFDSWATIHGRFGPAGIQEPVPRDGRLIVSDDTQMTLFTLEGLLRSAEDGSDRTAAIRAAYLDWYQTQCSSIPQRGADGGHWLGQQSEMHKQRAPGNTCLSALRSGGHGTIAQPANHSKGCGGVMRTAPIGFLHGLDASRVFQLGAEAGAITHGHPSGYLSAGAMAALVYLLLSGAPLPEAIEECRRVLLEYPGHEETLRAIDKSVGLAAEAPVNHVEAIESIGGGWVGEEAMAIALYAVLSSKSYKEVLTIAANHSGDSDSTASIAGQLWGVAHGLAGIPHEWVIGLDVLVPLLHTVKRWLELG